MRITSVGFAACALTMMLGTWSCQFETIPTKMWNRGTGERYVIQSAANVVHGSIGIARGSMVVKSCDLTVVIVWYCLYGCDINGRATQVIF